MYSPLTTFIDRLDAGLVPTRAVIDWSCPVPFFGDALTARIATVGINPSNREFVGKDGSALSGAEQRLPTLYSMGVSRWANLDALQIREIVEDCRGYFRRKPYASWFRVLDRLLAHSDASFYGVTPAACHLDLIPYATVEKWGCLPGSEQRALLESSADALGLLLRELPVTMLVLNGQSVVRRFEFLAGTHLEARDMANWRLQRGSRPAVPGVAYTGQIDRIGGIHLSRSVLVLGYNHNLQSSFGVTGQVISRIGRWIGSFNDVRTR